MKISNALHTTLLPNLISTVLPPPPAQASGYINAIDIAPSLRVDGFSVPSIFRRDNVPEVPVTPGHKGNADGFIGRDTDDAADMERDWRAEPGHRNSDEHISWGCGAGVGDVDFASDDWGGGYGNDDLFMVAVTFLKSLFAPRHVTEIEPSSFVVGAALIIPNT